VYNGVRVKNGRFCVGLEDRNALARIADANHKSESRKRKAVTDLKKGDET
jgi:hypothetical protein